MARIDCWPAYLNDLLVVVTLGFQEVNRDVRILYGGEQTDYGVECGEHFYHGLLISSLSCRSCLQQFFGGGIYGYCGEVIGGCVSSNIQTDKKNPRS